MSSKQDLYDLGLTFGLLGAFHAPDHTGDPDDDLARKNADFLAQSCGPVAVLTRAHEPRRILVPTPGDRDCVVQGAAHWLRTPASGVVLTRAFIDATGALALALPVTDHTIVSAQVLDDEDRILAFGMARVTRNRAFGPEGEVTALLAAIEESTPLEAIDQVRFHLNAGRGPCCLAVDTEYLDGIRESMADSEFDVSRFIAWDSETGSKGLSLVRIVEADIARVATDRVAFEVHTRDNDCVVCCAKHHGMPYYAPEDGRHNLAFVRTDRVLPRRQWGGW